jgi:hypothetical protein
MPYPLKLIYDDVAKFCRHLGLGCKNRIKIKPFYGRGILGRDYVIRKI